MYRLKLKIGQENGQVIDIKVYDYLAPDDRHDLTTQAKIHDENDKNFIDIACANATRRQSHPCGEDLKGVKGPDGHKYDASEYIELTWWMSYYNEKKTYTNKFYITQIPSAAGYGVVLGNNEADALRMWQRSQSHPVRPIALRNQTSGTTCFRLFKWRVTCQWK
jgi:hypothetical protein